MLLQHPEITTAKSSSTLSHYVLSVECPFAVVAKVQPSSGCQERCCALVLPCHHCRHKRCLFVSMISCCRPDGFLPGSVQSSVVCTVQAIDAEVPDLVLIVYVRSLLNESMYQLRFATTTHHGNIQTSRNINAAGCLRQQLLKSLGAAPAAARLYRCEAKHILRALGRQNKLCLPYLKNRL